MKSIFAVSLLIGVGVAGIAAQETRPTPVEHPDVVKISTDLIQIDVSATDAKGNVVNDLKQNELEVFENGRKQKIVGLTFVGSGRRSNSKTGGTPAPAKQDNPLADPKRIIALVVDDLTLSMESAVKTRMALTKFVDEQMQDGDLVAIISTGSGIGTLQRFTTEKARLRQAIERVRWRMSGGGDTGATSAIKPTEAEQGLVFGSDAIKPISGQDLADDRARERAAGDYRQSLFATGTIGSLTYIVDGLASLPGRKAVVLFSDGFKLATSNEQGVKEGGRVLDGLRQLVDKANRASVVFYTISARGLQTDGLSAEDKIAITTPRGNDRSNATFDPAAFDPVQQDLADRRNELQDTQAGLDLLAKQTGGSSTKNSNDLSYGVAKALDDQGYYLVAYAPDAETFDPKTRNFNKIEVKVGRSGVTARYRSGFFNVVDPAGGNGLTAAQKLGKVLTSPFAVNGIAVSLKITAIDPGPAGSMLRGTLHITASNMTFADNQDGTKKASFDLVAATFDAQGNAVDQTAKSISINASGAKYKKIIDDGFDLPFELLIKSPAAYQFRIGIRDTLGNRTGSASQYIEVPAVKKN